MIGIFGGTFDPVHVGHLSSALDLLVANVFDCIHFVPCKNPPHRAPPVASAQQRLQMLRLALAGQPGFVLDEREYQREGYSYMVDTLASVRGEFNDTPIALVIGSDAFSQIDQWQQWQRLLEYAHLVVLTRPGASMECPQVVQRWLAQHQVAELQRLKSTLCGSILMIKGRQLEVSASELRDRIGAQSSIRYLVPEVVNQYILENNIYQ